MIGLLLAKSPLGRPRSWRSCGSQFNKYRGQSFEAIATAARLGDAGPKAKGASLRRSLDASAPGRETGISRLVSARRTERLRSLTALKVHPHMLRHACGFDLVGRADLQARAAFMGHKRLENTVRYSKLDPSQFEGLRP